MKQGSTQLVNIQFARLLAALMVVLFHLQPHLGPDNLLAPIHYIGFAGVDIFFVISGFIMWHTTFATGAEISPVRFLARRFARIFLGYWPYLALALLALWWLSPALISRKDLWGSFWLLPVPIPQRVIPVSWTLTLELFFYLMFALLLWLPRVWAVRALVAGGLVVLSLNAYGLAFLDFYSRDFYQTSSPWERLPYAPYLLEFLAGSLACHWRPREATGYAGFLWLAGLLFLGGAIYNASVLSGQMDQGYHLIARVAFCGPAALALVQGLHLAELRGVRILPRLSQLGGGASYSLYLSHTILLGVFAAVTREPLWFWLALPLILGYSLIHYLWIEQPLHRWARRIR
jgi:peptidoglycan/LPS O-acetylase OafA/YrhL